MALEPIVRTIEVPCSQEDAFRIFLEMKSWWPLGKLTTSAIGGAPAKSIRVEPKGRIDPCRKQARAWAERTRRDK